MRVKGGNITRRRHKKILKIAKGFRGGFGRLFRPANQAVLKALYNAYKHRRLKKRDFRSLWIVRINAAARDNGISYSQLMNGLKKANVGINRKLLADIAVQDAQAFSQLVEKAKAAAK